VQSPGYYADRYAETRSLRHDLTVELADLGWEVIAGVANFLLCHLPPDGITAERLVAEARQRDLFLRDASAMGTRLGSRALRVAVKDPVTNQRMVEMLREIDGGRAEERGLSCVLTR
jgi:histidinol-phosphate/aromatic aminotransferase/cobyric acid decarboxylase-like protein